MELYKALSGEAGVAFFEAKGSRIIIEFTDGTRYLYDHACPGAGHVRNMIRLARQGRGLTTYINRHVRGNYAARLDQ